MLQRDLGACHVDAMAPWAGCCHALHMPWMMSSSQAWLRLSKMAFQPSRHKLKQVLSERFDCYIGQHQIARAQQEMQCNVHEDFPGQARMHICSNELSV